MSTFITKIEDIVNLSLVGLALTLANEVGILTVLIDAEQPLTSAEIAEKKNLKARYVRKILDCLATATVIHVDSDEEERLVYYLKPEENIILDRCRVCSFDFLKAMREEFDRVGWCVDGRLRHGQMFPKEYLKAIEQYHSAYFNEYMGHFYSYGGDLQERLDRGIKVLEVACLTGHMTGLIAERHPKSAFTAMDNDDYYHAQQRLSADGLSNVRFIDYDLYSPYVKTRHYDWIYCVNGIHDTPHPLVALRRIKRLLRPHSMYMMFDRTVSGNPISDIGNLRVAGMYSISAFFNIPESFYRDEKTEARGLCWGKRTALEMLTSAGFIVHTVELPDGITMYTCEVGRNRYEGKKTSAKNRKIEKD